MDLKQRLPWWFKMGAKIALSRIPLPYGFWRSLGLFKHGDMAHPDRALDAFRTHFERAVAVRPVAPGFVCLELGPGDSLLSGIIARAFGAARSYLVDGGNYAVRDTRPYVALVKLLREAGYDVPPVDRCNSLRKSSRCTRSPTTNGALPGRNLRRWSGLFMVAGGAGACCPWRASGDVAGTALRNPHEGVGSHSIDPTISRLTSQCFSERFWSSLIHRRAFTPPSEVSGVAPMLSRRASGWPMSDGRSGAAYLARAQQSRAVRRMLDENVEALRVAEFEGVVPDIRMRERRRGGAMLPSPDFSAGRARREPRTEGFVLRHRGLVFLLPPPRPRPVAQDAGI